MKIYSWNVNGIRAVIKKGALQSFITTYHPDILGLQEVKAEQNQVALDLPDYHIFWHNASRKGYAGTAIFTKIKPLTVVYGFPDQLTAKYNFLDDQQRNVGDEGRLITAEYDNFYFVTVYTPNTKEDLSRLKFRQQIWDSAFLEYMKSLEITKPVIFCGDLNVAYTADDLANPKANEGKHGYTIEERLGFQKYIDAGFIDTFRIFTQGKGHYSWWTHWANARQRNIGWRIDYILVSGVIKNKIKQATIHANVDGSDHCPIGVELDF